MELVLRIIIAGVVGFWITLGCVRIFYRYRSGKTIRAVPDEERIDLLRRYSEYKEDNVSRKHPPEFVLGRPAPKILQKYNYSDYCKTDPENEDAIVFSMLDFVCDNFRHYSHAVTGGTSLEGVIKSCEKHEQKTNCRGLSLILAELLRMNGIKARHITCKPYEEPFQDCHVVVDCLLPSGSRIMLDPTYRLYFTDDNGDPVSLQQLREEIIAGRDLHANKNASYNGSDFDYDFYIEYMSKNVLRFNANYRSDNTDHFNSQIELIPKGYSTEGYPKNVQYTTSPDYFWDMG